MVYPTGKIGYTRTRGRRKPSRTRPEPVKTSTHIPTRIPAGTGRVGYTRGYG